MPSSTTIAVVIAACVAMAVVVVVMRLRSAPQTTSESTRRQGSRSEGRTAGAAKPAGEKQQDRELNNRLRQIQEAYWTLDREEKEALLAKSLDALSWREKLRLLHLTVLEILETEEGKRQLTATEMTGASDAPDGEPARLCADLVKRLMVKESPFRPRRLAIWQGTPNAVSERPADIEAFCRNASITHLGAIEVIRLDEKGEPRELAFVGLDEIRGAIFQGRAARLFYDDGRQDEIVWVPLLYGWSWRTPNTYDQDGTMTRFRCHVKVEGIENRLAVGIGHQDVVARQQDGSQTLFGIGSVGEIAVGLELDDPKFEAKCRARGLDPAEVRGRFKKPGAAEQ